MEWRRGMGPAGAVALVFFLGSTCFLVAAALPMYLKHQMRSREMNVKIELQALVEAERAARARDGSFVAFPPLPSQQPGPARTPLSAADRQVASRLGWNIGPATYGQFRITVARSSSGDEAASFCAETDLDDDGVRGARFAFLPMERSDGTLTAPPAPCTTPVPYSNQYKLGELLKVETLDH
jgi:hypothetical protein